MRSMASGLNHLTFSEQQNEHHVEERLLPANLGIKYTRGWVAAKLKYVGSKSKDNVVRIKLRRLLSVSELYYNRVTRLKG